MLISSHDLYAIGQIAITGILNSVPAGIAIALLAWAVTQRFGRHGSGTRFAVWFSALVAIAILPWVCHFAYGGGNATSSIPRSVVTLPISFASYLFAVWTVGASLGLMRVGRSLYRLQQLRATCVPVDLSQLGLRLSSRLAEIQTHRRVALCSSAAVRVPSAMGYFRPIVVFPAWALQEIPAAELEAILLHELAHIRRWDDWTNLVQKIVKAVFFFHPAVWFIEDRLSLEREMACDDVVLAADFSPRDYAESLLGLAEKSFLRRGVHLAQAAVSHVQQLKTRIVAILRKDREASGRVWKPAIALMAIAAIVSGYSVSYGPHLFAFSSDQLQIAPSVASANSEVVPIDARLRPLNLSFENAAARETGITSDKTSTTGPRMTPGIALKPHAALAQSGAQHQLFEGNFVAPLRMVLSSGTLPQNSEVPTAVLVVMRGKQFGVNGPVLWRLSIVHLTQYQQRRLTGGDRKRT